MSQEADLALARQVAQEFEERKENIKDVGGILRTEIASGNGVFAETLQLTSEGQIDWNTPDGNLVSPFAALAILEQSYLHEEGFTPAFKIAIAVSRVFPNLQFIFVLDSEHGSLRYSVANKPHSTS